jgi:hypothetical protein
MLELPTITKIHNPLVEEDFLLDWTAYLTQIGIADTITASTWTVGNLPGTSTPDPAITIGVTSFTGTTATIWVIGGTGPVTSVVNHVTTAGGRTPIQTLFLRIRSL